MATTILFIDSHDHPTCMEKFNGVRRFASMLGWNAIRRKTTPDLRQVSNMVKTAKPAGCIVNAVRFHARIPPSAFGPVPVVYLDTDPNAFGRETHVISHDSIQTGILAAKELLSLRLKRFYYIPYKSSTFWCGQRWRGFSKTISAAGFPVERIRLHQSRHNLAMPPSSGIMAANDEMAEMLLSRLRSAGCHIPRDVVVISADDSEIARLNGITSIRIDFEHGGYIAAEMLASIIKGRPCPVKMKFGDVCIQHRNSTRHLSQTLPRIPEAIALIREKACSGLSAADVIRVLDAPRRTVEEHFRKSTGHSILQEIQSVRMECAFGLLSSTTRSISSIVDACGYHTPQAMRKAFRLHAGISMQEWQKREVLKRLQENDSSSSC